MASFTVHSRKAPASCSCHRQAHHVECMHSLQGGTNSYTSLAQLVAAASARLGHPTRPNPVHVRLRAEGCVGRRARRGRTPVSARQPPVVADVPTTAGSGHAAVARSIREIQFHNPQSAIRNPQFPRGSLVLPRYGRASMPRPQRACTPTSTSCFGRFGKARATTSGPTSSTAAAARCCRWRAPSRATRTRPPTPSSSCARSWPPATSRACGSSTPPDRPTP